MMDLTGMSGRDLNSCMRRGDDKARSKASDVNERLAVVSKAVLTQDESRM